VAQASRMSRLLVPVAFWLGLVAAGLALWMSGQVSNAWTEVRGARLLPLVLVMLAGLLLPVINARRWQLVMRALGTDMPLTLATDMTVSASLVNYASPGYVGAPAKAFLANRSVQAPYSRSLVSIAFEQGLDFLVLVAVSTVALFVLGPDRLGALAPDVDQTTRIMLALLLLILGGGIVVAGRRRIARAFARIVDAFRTLADRVDRATIALLTLIYWVVQAVVVALLLWALRLPLSLTTVLALASIPLLLGQIAPVPGGIGAREAAIVALSAATGASAVGLLGLAVLQRVLLTLALPLSLGVLRLAGSRSPESTR
jgi:glycosyltransferase 2 family protein